ncbi:MAG: PilZ domain-containing protein [Deltaproteobacteria bacterium]|nr:PilZ domain-containing protein [Deltaproteobacteria bacterium]
MKNEKRRYPRVDFVIEALFEAESRAITDLHCENISMSGLFLRTDAPLPVGTRGNLNILLECGEERLEVRAQCRVARVVGVESGQPLGMGLEYISLDPDSSLALYNVVRYQGGFTTNDQE